MKHYFEVIKQTRKNFLNLIAGLSIEEVNKVPTHFNNNLIWNLGHVVATQQALCYKLSGLEAKVDMGLFGRYGKGTKPEAFVPLEEFDLIKTLVLSTIVEFEEDYNSGLFKTYNNYTTSFGVALSNIDEAIHFVSVHEGLHMGYAMALKKSI